MAHTLFIDERGAQSTVTNVSKCMHAYSFVGFFSQSQLDAYAPLKTDDALIHT